MQPAARPRAAARPLDARRHARHARQPCREPKIIHVRSNGSGAGWSGARRLEQAGEADKPKQCGKCRRKCRAERCTHARRLLLDCCCLLFCGRVAALRASFLAGSSLRFWVRAPAFRAPERPDQVRLRGNTRGIRVGPLGRLPPPAQATCSVVPLLPAGQWRARRRLLRGVASPVCCAARWLGLRTTHRGAASRSGLTTRSCCWPPFPAGPSSFSGPRGRPPASSRRACCGSSRARSAAAPERRRSRRSRCCGQGSALARAAAVGR